MSAESSCLLSLECLTKAYGEKTAALSEVTLQVSKGEFVSVIGCSGAGKSTLLRCVNKLIEPSSGKVDFEGHDVLRVRGRELREIRRRISMVFQHYNLVSRSSAMENVLQGRLGYKSSVMGALGIFSEEEKRQALKALAQVGLADFAYRRVDQLSGGQKQRVGIARALVQNPSLVLADEPIASLDPKSSRTVMELLRWVASDLGVACLVSLHQVEYAIEFSDRVVGLAGGRIVFDGPPADLDEAIVRQIYGSGNFDDADGSDDFDEVQR